MVHPVLLGGHSQRTSIFRLEFSQQALAASGSGMDAKSGQHSAAITVNTRCVLRTLVLQSYVRNVSLGLDLGLTLLASKQSGLGLKILSSSKCSLMS